MHYLIAIVTILNISLAVVLCNPVEESIIPYTDDAVLAGTEAGSDTNTNSGCQSITLDFFLSFIFVNIISLLINVIALAPHPDACSILLLL